MNLLILFTICINAFVVVLLTAHYSKSFRKYYDLKFRRKDISSKEVKTGYKESSRDNTQHWDLSGGIFGI
ncbi:MAG TPA: hypothetical protein VNZ86_07135 [Bacteroidia bacterium]|jgi:hypothetical protein|nr:hypothetical protein [Bacteroidia bacterium]